MPVTVRLSLNFIEKLIEKFIKKFIHLIERTEVVSGETYVTIFLAVRRAEVVGIMIQKRIDR
jgi:hypothetical protein